MADVQCAWKSFHRPVPPPQYFALVISSLLAMAFVGQQVHNLFLTYLIGK